MISNVNFTGRETLLTEGVGVAAAKTVDRFHDYVGVGAMDFPKIEDTFVKEAKAVKEAVKKAVKVTVKENVSVMPKPVNPELSYAISHGKPKAELVEMFGKNIDYKA